VPAVALWTTTLLIALSLSLWGTSWAQAAMLEAILDPEFKPEWTQCYRDSWPKVASFSWVCVLFFAVLCGGLVFVVPALFLGVAFVFAPVLVVAEQIGAFESFERSLALVSGRWGAVALRLFAGGAASALPGMIPWLGVILGSVAAPFAMINAVVVYDSLRRLPARSEPPPWCRWAFAPPACWS
jgi:hypothetical protein